MSIPIVQGTPVPPPEDGGGGFGAALDNPPPAYDTPSYPPPPSYGGAVVPSAGGGLLDEQTVQLLDSVNTFYIQQKVQWLEAISQGCFEQPNIYTIFDKDQNRRIMVVQEESENCNRCCCKPEHSFYAKFSLADEEGKPLGVPVMTMEREGCDCCFTGPCPKPCLCCFACTEGCSDKASFYAGNISIEASKPGSTNGGRETTQLIGASVQPTGGGGGFKPVMQIMERGDGGEPQMFAAARGPICFGGCSECCCDTRFGVSKAPPNASVSEIHQLHFGDYATITKKKPHNLQGVIREFLTDVDLYEVQFVQPVSAQQKANVLGTMIHLDYMFFERDNDMIYCDSEGLHIVLFNCFCYGCICPCECTFSNSGDGGGGGE